MPVNLFQSIPNTTQSYQEITTWIFVIYNQAVLPGPRTLQASEPAISGDTYSLRASASTSSAPVCAGIATRTIRTRPEAPADHRGWRRGR